MKKLFVALLILFAMGPLSAQFFGGGSFSLSSSGGSVDNGSAKYDKTSTMGIDFGPMAGYFISDRLAAGLRISYSLNREKTPAPIADGNETIDVTSGFGITPFVRYYGIHLNKFAIYGQGQLGLSSGSSKTKVGGTTTNGPKTTTFSLSVFPGLEYELTTHVSLETNIHLFSLGYSVQTQKTDIAGTETKNTTTNFKFGAGVDNIINIGGITIGAIYRF